MKRSFLAGIAAGICLLAGVIALSAAVSPVSSIREPSLSMTFGAMKGTRTDAVTIHSPDMDKDLKPIDMMFQGRRISFYVEPDGRLVGVRIAGDKL